MSAAQAAGPEPPPRVVQCGWCPVILADDYVAWYLHFAEDHNYYGGYSIRHNIQGPDWDVAELSRYPRR